MRVLLFLVVVIVVVLSGCRATRQVVRVQETLPMASMDRSVVTASYEVEWK